MAGQQFEQLQSLLAAGGTMDTRQGSARDDKPAKAVPVGYGALAPGLSQLTELLLEQARVGPQQSSENPAPSNNSPSAAEQPESSSEPPQGATILGPSSQPDGGPPQLMESQGPTTSGPPMIGAGYAQTQAEQTRTQAVPSFLPLANVDFASMQSNPELFASLAAWTLPPGHLPQLASQGEEVHAFGTLAGGSGRQKPGRPTRRGPMDEMRQLVRILLKLLPHSIGQIGVGEEAGGGNRISEEQIKGYLDATLGEAPRPTWGVPGGWNSYVATLISWATGKPVADEEARRVARREPGRSWEALEPELAALGVHPNCWPLPLTLEGVRAAEENPVPLPVPQLPAPRKASMGDDAAGTGKRGGRLSFDLERASEVETWRHLLEVLRALEVKAGLTPAEAAAAAELPALKMEARTRFESVLALAAAGPLTNTSNNSLGMLPGLQYVPVMGMDGGSGMLTLLGGLGNVPVATSVQAQQDNGGRSTPPDPSGSTLGERADPEGGGQGSRVVGPFSAMFPSNLGAGGPASPLAALLQPPSTASMKESSAEPPRKRNKTSSSSGNEGDTPRGEPTKGLLSSSQARESLIGSLEGTFRNPEGGGYANAEGAAAVVATFPVSGMYPGLTSAPQQH